MDRRYLVWVGGENVHFDNFGSLHLGVLFGRDDELTLKFLGNLYTDIFFSQGPHSDEDSFAAIGSDDVNDLLCD